MGNGKSPKQIQSGIHNSRSSTVEPDTTRTQSEPWAGC